MWIYDGNIGPQGTIRHYGTLVFFNWKRSFDGFFFYWRRFDAILDFVMLFLLIKKNVDIFLGRRWFFLRIPHTQRGGGGVRIDIRIFAAMSDFYHK